MTHLPFEHSYVRERTRQQGPEPRRRIVWERVIPLMLSGVFWIVALSLIWRGFGF